MEILNVSVPFIYSAFIVPPRCRNERKIQAKDSVNIVIRNADKYELPFAFIIHYKHRNPNKLPRKSLEMTAYEGRLWIPHPELQNNTYGKANIQRVIGSALKLNHHNLSYTGKQANINYRSWRDIKDVEIESIRARANDLLFIHGKCHVPFGEPLYQVTPFTGFYTVFGSALKLKHKSNNISALDSSEFRIDQLDEAMAYATKVARDKGYQDFIPCDVPKVEILMPSMIQAKK